MEDGPWTHSYPVLSAMKKKHRIEQKCLTRGCNSGQGPECFPEATMLKGGSEGQNQNKPAKEEGRRGQINGKANPENQVMAPQKAGH